MEPSLKRRRNLPTLSGIAHYTPPAGSATVTNQSAILIWPNPAGEQITIAGADLTGSVVSVTNAIGELVWKAKATTYSLQIDRTTLGVSGVYFVNIINSRGESIQKEKLIFQ